MPLLKKKSVLAAKIEETAGTAIALSASDGAFNVFDANIELDTEPAKRNSQSSFSQMPAEPGALAGSCTFETELDSAWSAILLPACGFVLDSSYAPVSEVPGTNAKTLTIGHYQNGRLKKLKGAMGNAVFIFESGKPVRVEWTFTGVWVAPVDAVMLAPTYPTDRPARFMGAGLTIGAWSPVVQSLRIDLGNALTLRESGNGLDGYVCAVVASREVVGSLNPESSLIATKDIYNEMNSVTEAALSFTVSGITFSIPKLQFIQIKDGDREGILIDEIEFQANKTVSTGDDEITITFGSPTTSA